jgi:hypothetical protein
MTTPSKAAMDAAKKWIALDETDWEWSAPEAVSLAQAFDAFAASQSAALLEALEQMVAYYPYGNGVQAARAAIAAAAAEAADRIDALEAENAAMRRIIYHYVDPCDTRQDDEAFVLAIVRAEMKGPTDAD